MGCAMSYGAFEITAHAHAQVLKSVALGNLSQKIKVFFWFLINWWNARESGNGKSMGVAAFLNESVSAGNVYTRLLFFIPRIDLNEELDLPVLFFHLGSHELGNARPVQGVNGIKQAHRISGFVCL